MFYVELIKAKDIKRDELGYPYAWTSGKTIASFKSSEQFIIYVKKNYKQLTNAVAFSGSAGLMATCNGYIAVALKKAELL